MPRLDKAIRRDERKSKERKMRVSGRGLITDIPNLEKRKIKKEKADLRRE